MRPWLLSCVLLAACTPDAPAPATRVRLWAEVPAELRERPLPPAATQVFASRFEQDLEGWEPIITPWRESGGLATRLTNEDGTDCVELTGRHGGLHAVVPVEPETCYVFTGRLRTRALVPEEASFDGARFWLAQASAEASFAEFRTTKIALMTDAWSSPSVYRSTGWQEQRRVFVTRPETRLLHLVCALATEDDVRSGGVCFADLRLEQHPLEHYWRAALVRESAARTHIDPPAPGEQATRRVAAELGGETRPALVLLPGESLRFRLPALAPAAVLEFQLGPWAPALIKNHGGRARLHVRVGSRPLLTRTLELPATAQEARWSSVEVPLPESAPTNGAPRALEFELEGDAPLAIGAPVARAPTPDSSLPPSVFLISIDTLRADHVGAYGYDLDTTPHLDRLAERGLVCKDTSAQAPYTLPSHATLLTGQFPSVHGVVAHESTLGAARSTSLAECLARAGYATRAFTAGGFVNSVFGLDQGFDGFSEIDPIREEGSHYFRTLARTHGEDGARKLLEEQGFPAVERWLRARGPEPFFLFLHTYAVHDYDSPRRFLACTSVGCGHPQVALRTDTPDEAAAYTPEMRAHLQHLYDGALRYTDERLGQLFALLGQLGRLENTLIVVTSDHGEEFFEHGALQHGRTLYEELLRIPLVFAGPGVPARTLERPAMLTDVTPTILARLGLAPPPHLQGLDLLGQDWAPRPIWSEVDSRFAHKYALRTEDGAKTMHGPTTAGIKFPNERAWEQYELGRDSQELLDLYHTPTPAREAARRALEEQRARLEELGTSLGAAGHGEVDAGTLRELDELGYGGG